MAEDNSQKILEALHQLEQRLENGFSQVRDELGKVREEMQGGFGLTHERIAQSEQNIRHILESMVDLHDSLDKRVEKLEEKIESPHSH